MSSGHTSARSTIFPASPLRRMPRLALLLLLAAAAGCAPRREPIRRAVVTRVVAEALPLDRAWDGAIAANAPDVYVDFKEGNARGPLDFRAALVRTEVAEDLEPRDLPRSLRVNVGSFPLPVRMPLRIVVADRDGGEFGADDVLFATEISSLASRRGDAAPGDTTALRFGDDRTRLVVTVRWE